MTHTDAVKLSLMTLSELGCMPWRNEVGLFRDQRGTPRKIGVNGSADVLGIAPGGRAVAVEVKTGDARRTKEQKRWGARFTQLGGIYCVARFGPRDDGRETIRQTFRLAGFPI